MLTVEVYAREVRVVKQDSYTQQQDGQDQTQGGQTQETQQNTATAPLEPGHTKSADASSLKNQGRVQAAPPTPAQDAATNYVSGSANDGLNRAASGGEQPGQISAAQTRDRANNPPAGLSPASQGAYSTTITRLSGGGYAATGSW
jgi:hypothetical protein